MHDIIPFYFGITGSMDFKCGDNDTCPLCNQTICQDIVQWSQFYVSIVKKVNFIECIECRIYICICIIADDLNWLLRISSIVFSSV